MLGEAAHVHFIDHGIRIGLIDAPILSPVIEIGVYHNALDGLPAVVSRLGGGSATVATAGRHRVGVGVDQELIAVIPQPLFRGIRSGDAIAVKLSVPDSW